MEFSYQQIKSLAKELGRPVTDLIALAAQNDPFYQNTPSSLALGEWFAEFYHNSVRFERIHLRRCHYLLVTLAPTLPNGKPYENTEACWDTLGLAAKAARYLGLVPFENIIDKKNAAPADYSYAPAHTPEIDVNGYLYTSDLQLPDFPALPTFDLRDYDSTQRYHLEIWCEKSTMDDILLPLCQRYGMCLQTASGEQSITAAHALAERIARNNKPTRVFYISDFDPAGLSMPVAVARKLEYFVRSRQADADVRLFPLVLTPEQTREYNLPRTPIKEKEKRRDHFEQLHGEGATELDALEALYPGALRRIVQRAILRYYDDDLSARVQEQKREIEGRLDAARQEAMQPYQDEIDALQALIDGIHADVGERMQEYSERVQSLWLAINNAMQEQMPDVDTWPIPEAEEGEELGEGLYNSQRSYLDQIEMYKAFQGKQRETAE